MASLLRLYNTLSRAKEPLRRRSIRAGADVCLRPDRLRRRPYRHARPLIVFDLLFRLLRHVYGGRR